MSRFIDSKYGARKCLPVQGEWLNHRQIEVDNVDCLYEELRQQGEMEFLLPIKSEDFGQRHFIVAPGSVLLMSRHST